MPVSTPAADVLLLPGEVSVVAQPTTIRTIVGSCVAVCLWDRVRRVGGVNHFLLPRPIPEMPPSARFGTLAMRQLIERACLLGAKPDRMEAAVIGGAYAAGASCGIAIGDENVAVALDFLAEMGVRVLRRETGGTHGRRILCDPATARLDVQQLRGWGQALGGSGQ